MRLRFEAAAVRGACKPWRRRYAASAAVPAAVRNGGGTGQWQNAATAVRYTAAAATRDRCGMRRVRFAAAANISYCICHL